MTHIMRHEVAVFVQAPPTSVHLQSQFQSGCIRHHYEDWGCRNFKIVRGAFEPLAFSPRQHLPGEPFVVGRLARPARTKWTPYLWNILGEARDRGVDVRALCMGWSAELDHHCGRPPEWAECLEPAAISTAEFLSRCHALICPNWVAKENWPRIGLEAASAGVPLLVDDVGGWREMGLGVLCDSPGAFRDSLVFLAGNEESRMALILRDRVQVEVLADWFAIASEWGSVFAGLE
jgi:glycosyltransferase involved in cell wall biosynthesis